MSEVPQPLAEWTLDTAILQVRIKTYEGSEEEFEIPINVQTLGVTGAKEMIDLRLVPVWRKMAEETTVAVNPETNERRRIEKGTVMTYADTPVAVDCMKPDELVEDDRQ